MWGRRAGRRCVRRRPRDRVSAADSLSRSTRSRSLHICQISPRQRPAKRASVTLAPAMILFVVVEAAGERAPASAEVARFVRPCSDAGLPFKASAGLHQAVRSGEAHGFLNLLAAALCPERAEEALDEEDPAAFAVDAARFVWSGREA